MMEEETCKCTLAMLEYKGKKYCIIHEWAEYYPLDGAIYMWEEGNYSCDCNRSIFIQDKVDKSFEIMDCGDEIKLVELRHYW